MKTSIAQVPSHISTGLMRLGDTEFDVAVGDTVLILPGTAHAIRNAGASPLKILCACAPAYAHDDTELLQVAEGREG